jgi:hypothetical protein
MTSYAVLVVSPWRFIGPQTPEPTGPLHLTRQDGGAPLLTVCEVRIPLNAVRIYTIVPGDLLCTACRDAGQRAGHLLELPEPA